MDRQFNPPSLDQLRWLIARDLDTPYITEVLNIYELLRGHSANHGLPYGVPPGVGRTEYEESLRSQLGELRLLKVVREALTADDPDQISVFLPEAIAENARNAQKLFDEVRERRAGPELVDEFLNGVLDCYNWISRAAPARED